MECYSPNRKNPQCFKKNRIKKKIDDGIMINRIQKNEIVFEFSKPVKKKVSNEITFFENFALNLKNLFYNRVRTFFDYEDYDLSTKNKNYKNDYR